MLIVGIVPPHQAKAALDAGGGSTGTSSNSCTTTFCYQSDKQIIATSGGFPDVYNLVGEDTMPKGSYNQDHYYFRSTKKYSKPTLIDPTGQGQKASAFSPSYKSELVIDVPKSKTTYGVLTWYTGSTFLPVQGYTNLSLSGPGPKEARKVKIHGALMFSPDDQKSMVEAEPSFFDNFSSWFTGSDNNYIVITDDLGSSTKFMSKNAAGWSYSNSDYSYNGQTYKKVSFSPGEAYLRTGTQYTMTFSVNNSNGSGGGLSQFQSRSVIYFEVGDTGTVKIVTDGLAQKAPINNNPYTSEKEYFLPVTITEVDAVTLAMTKVISVLSGMVKESIGLMSDAINKQLNASANMMDSTNSTALKNTWTTLLRFTLSLLTLALLIIAFANILNVDEKLGYGLNRMIPKIVISIALALFSYFLTRILLDLAAAFQAGLFNAASSWTADPMAVVTGNGGAFQQVESAVNGLAMSIFMVVLMIILLVATLWLMILLIVRYAMIWILVALAPVAMLMNILPFTESYYKMWWKEWWKWLFMGPAIALFLYLASAILDGFTTAFASGSGGEAWLLLIVSTVCIVMAGTIPLTMGGKVMSMVANPIKKAATSPVKDRWGQFQNERSQYKKQVARKQVTQLRGQLGTRFGALGRVAAGTGGLRKGPGFLGTDQTLAIAAQGEAIKLMTDGEKLAAAGREFKTKGGITAAAEANDPRAIALLQDIAKNIHSAGYSPEVKLEMAKAVGSASENLIGTQSLLKANPNSDAARDMFNEAVDRAEKEKVGVAELVGTERFGKLAIEAAKKSAGKPITERDGDDIKALRAVQASVQKLSEKTNVELSKSRKGTEQYKKETDKAIENISDAMNMSVETLRKDAEFFANPAQNKAHYVASTPTKRQQEQEAKGYKFADTSTDNKAQNEPRPAQGEAGSNWGDENHTRFDG